MADQVWGRPGFPGKENQDLVSDPQYHNVLQVNTDIGQGGGADKIAIHVLNLNADAEARALKVEGKTEFSGNIQTTENSHSSLKINDVNLNNDANIALHVVNSSNNWNAHAIKSEGMVEVIGVNADQQDIWTTALKVSNSSLSPNSVALDVDGQAVITANTRQEPAPIDSIGLIVINNSLDDNAKALVVRGRMDVEAAGAAENPIIVMRGYRIVAQEAQGSQQLLFDLGIGNPMPLLLNSVINQNWQYRVYADSLKVDNGALLDCLVDIGTTLGHRDLRLHGNIEVDDKVKMISNGQPVLEISGTYIDTTSQSNLQIATTNNSGSVEISRPNRNTSVNGTFTVDGETILKARIKLGDDENDGFIDCNAIPENNRDIKIGALDNTQNVLLSRPGQTTIVNSSLKICDNAGGSIDANASELEPADLFIGIHNYTRDIWLGRNDRTAWIQSNLKVGHFPVGDGKIDSNGADLKIGTQESTNDVAISRINQVVSLGGNLLVGKKAIEGIPGQLARIDSNTPEVQPVPLYIGSLNQTLGLRLGRSGVTNHSYGPLATNEGLTVGTRTTDGTIDCNALEEDERDLRIGCEDVTSDVVISRSGKTTLVQGRLQVDEELIVGPDAGPALINSGGSIASPQDLKIGNDAVTANVKISRSGQIADILGNARLNGNAIIMNGKSSITENGARGIVDNPIGQGAGGASLDFYINGQCVFYIDAGGGHNV